MMPTADDRSCPQRASAAWHLPLLGLVAVLVVLGAPACNGESGPSDTAPTAGIDDGPVVPASAGEFLRLKRVPIVDHHGWAEPVSAYAILLPADWRVDAGVRWPMRSPCVHDMIEEHLVATSPDGRLGFSILPSYAWQWGNDAIAQQSIQLTGCTLAPPLDAYGALQQILLPRFRPTARVVDLQPAPEIARGAYEDYYAVWGPVLEMQGMRLATDALAVRLEYEEAGRAYEEWLTFSLAQVTTASMVTVSFTYRVAHVYLFRAPRGELARHGPLFSTIVGSLRVNPVWQTAVVGVISNVSTQASLAAGQRAGIWYQAMSQIGEMRARSWQTSQDSLGRAAVAWSRAMRGVNEFHDPFTAQTVPLPVGYSRAWASARGEYLVSVDPAFDPNVSLGPGEWRAMGRAPN